MLNSIYRAGTKAYLLKHKRKIQALIKKHSKILSEQYGSETKILREQKPKKKQQGCIRKNFLCSDRLGTERASKKKNQSDLL